MRHPIGPRTHWCLQCNLSLLHGTVSGFNVVATNCLGAKSLVHVTAVHVSSLLWFFLCVTPRPGVTRGQGWATHRCHTTRLATSLGSLCSPCCGPSPWFTWPPMVAQHRCHICKGHLCIHAYACAHRCHHLRSSCLVSCRLMLGNHFSNIVPLTYVIRQWDCDRALRPMQTQWGNAGLNCRTSAVRRARTHYGQLYC